MSNSQVKSPLAGKSVYFVGKLAYRYEHVSFVQRLQADGVKVVDDITDTLGYLVLGTTGFSAAKKKAEQLNQKKGSITIIDEGDFNALLVPTLDVVLEWLRTPGTGVARAGLIYDNPRYKSHLPSLSGQDLSKADLRGLRINHYHFVLDGIDLREANLSDTMLSFQNCQLEGAQFAGATVQNLADCSATGVDFSKVPRIGGYGGEFKNNDFSRCKFAGVKLAYSNYTGSKFEDADLRGAILTRSNFQGVSLRGADLSGVTAAEAAFAQADLCGCKLVNANLTCANLKGANVEGADFTGAVLAGADLTDVDLTNAIGFDPASTQSPANTGLAVKEWIKAAKKAQRLETTVKVVKDKQEIIIRVTMYRAYVTAQDDHGGFWSEMGYGPPPHRTADQVLTIIGNHWAGAVPNPGSITISASKASKPTRELKPLAIAMWCELFGMPVPSAEDLKEQAKTAKASKKSQFDEWVQILRNDPAGVEKWGKELATIRKQLGNKFTGVDLSKADLAGWHCNSFDCKDANLAEANLRNAHFVNSKLTGVNLTKANCQEAELLGTILKNSVCNETDFTSARLGHADLCGADLTGAILTNATFEGAKFDSDTKFPKGFKPTLEMKWQGDGPSPAHQAQVAKLKAKKPLDINAFMKRLKAGVDPAKLSKALSMLQADRFKLYAEVTDEHLVGIVKSQGDANLVYSCKLASNGVYGCCTQNLNICGGLRGSLCKHLLVLIVGLAKAGDLDPNTIDSWVLSSRGQKPAIDKDSASETFLRYKGAEAGEVDWRPTETIPEDYYAM